MDKDRRVQADMAMMRAVEAQRMQSRAEKPV